MSDLHYRSPDIPGRVPSGASSADEPEEFNWHTDDSIIVESQPALAVYRNGRGHVVVRAEAIGIQDEDSFIFLATADSVKGLITALQRELKAGGAG
jgi:hypothetical protein